MRRSLIVLTAALLWASPISAQEARAPVADNRAEPAAVTPDTDVYLLGPEDVIRVFVWKEPDLTTSVMIRPDGRISLPLVDDLQAAGRSAAEVQELVRQALARYIESPVVNVVVEEINNPKVSVLGEVRLPGRYSMRQSLTVLDAIALAGGFTEFANRGNVVIVRRGPGGTERIRLDLAGILDGDRRDVPMLQAADTVYVR